MSSSFPPPAHWASSLGFVLAAAGAAIGLGNLWKFPYMVGAHNGGWFVLYYILCMVVVGLPVLFAEIALGRLARRNPIDTVLSFVQKHHLSSLWMLTPILGCVVLTVVLSFYSVVAGWLLAYVFYYPSGVLHTQDPQVLSSFWAHFLSQPAALCGWHLLFLLMTLGVISAGIQKGIERLTKILMPVLFVVMLCMLAFVAVHDHFGEAVRYVFVPQGSVDHITTLRAAMGQAFFSLATGAGCMLVYGAYIPSGMRIVPALTVVSLLNVAVALLASLIIFPMIFAYNLPTAQGPTLMFQILPLAFAQMPYGALWGTSFFVLLFVAALTSSISMAEPLVMLVIERTQQSRLRASCWVGVLTGVLGCFLALSLNVLRHQHPWGFDSWFDAAATLSADYGLLLGALGFTCLAGWHLSAPIIAILQLGPWGARWWRVCTRYVAPATLIALLLT